MSNKNDSACNGIGLCTILFIVFLILKLYDVINWSWWWVTAPIWMPFIIFIAVCAVVFIVAFIVGVIKSCIKLWEERNGKE